MLVKSKEILLEAKKGHYAIPHFNINNLEWAKYILEEFLPQDFCDLTISDRPDIKQSDKTGIEVTRTFIANQAYAEGIFEQIKNKQLGEISPVKISKLGRLGYKVLENKGVVAGICPREAFWVNIEPLKNP